MAILLSSPGGVTGVLHLLASSRKTVGKDDTPLRQTLDVQISRIRFLTREMGVLFLVRVVRSDCLAQHDAVRHFAGGDQTPQFDESFRASATIMVVLRAPLVPSVRGLDDVASALSFWNIKNREASWIMPRRTRALPALASPFSRRLRPLSSGEPVRPP